MTALQKWMDAHEAETDGSLSTKVGVSRVQILRIRLGQNRPSPATALKLQEVTGIPVSKLLYEDQDAAA